MRILILTEKYFPEIGGLQSVTHSLAMEFLADGHDVVIVTFSQDTQGISYPYKIVRQPTALTIFFLVKWCDIFYQACLGLKTLWPLVFIRRPWFVTHHMLLDSGTSWQRAIGLLKKRLAKQACGISISKFMAGHVGDGSIVISNPYDDAVFFLSQDVKPKNSIVFVGRLIHAKGCHVLLQALAILGERGVHIECTIVGDGPERHVLENLARELHLTCVRFIGYLIGDLLANELRNHSVIAVPSIWPEPFGVVALEGIASGCIAVASDVGGLPEAVGNCGLLVPPNSPRALADSITIAISITVDADERRRHLSLHQRRYVGEAYLREFKRKTA